MRQIIARLENRKSRPSEFLQLQAKVHSFEKSLECKEAMLSMITQVVDKREAMLYISTWIHEPFISN
jgi:hypothetical protein